MVNFLEAGAAPSAGGWTQYLFIGVLLVFMIGMMFFSQRRQKKQKEKVEKMINALTPGNKVKTIGGIMGTIVEKTHDGMFVIETGSNDYKSYIKFDKSAIYAAGENAAEAKEQAEVSTVEPKEDYNETVDDE